MQELNLTYQQSKDLLDKYIKAGIALDEFLEIGLRALKRISGKLLM